MKPIHPLFRRCTVISVVIFLFSSCEDPEIGTGKEPPESVASPFSDSDSTITTKASEPEPAVEEPSSTAPAPSAKPEPTYPELRVYLSGETLIMEGALRSRLQKARIAEEMAREFPDWTIEDRILVERHRYAVGWGNRVSNSFLVPYFREIKNPAILYKDGVVFLKGEYGEGRLLKQFQELAVSVFAGMHLKDIKNEMVAGSN